MSHLKVKNYYLLLRSQNSSGRVDTKLLAIPPEPLFPSKSRFLLQLHIRTSSGVQ